MEIKKGEGTLWKDTRGWRREGRRQRETERERETYRGYE